MTLKNFFKENIALIMGLTLPVILIALFFLATVLPKSLATPPQYPLIFATTQYDSASPPPVQIGFVVKNGALYARINKTDRKYPGAYSKRLMLYDGKTENVREIGYDISQFSGFPDGSDVILDETKGMTLDTSIKSPDGYSFEGYSYGHGGLVQEVFGGGYRNRNPRLKKGAAAYKIPNTTANPNYYGDIQFIGWVVKK